MSLSSRRIHVLTASSILIAGFGSLFVQAIAEDGVNDKSGLVVARACCGCQYRSRDEALFRSSGAYGLNACYGADSRWEIHHGQW